jgi:hypothetical protein
MQWELRTCRTPSVQKLQKPSRHRVRKALSCHQTALVSFNNLIHPIYFRLSLPKIRAKRTTLELNFSNKTPALCQGICRSFQPV